MVSLRRRRLLGLSSVTQLPLYESSSQNANPPSGQSVIMDIANVLDNNTAVIDESGSSNVSRSSPSKEQPSQQNTGVVLKEEQKAMKTQMVTLPAKQDRMKTIMEAMDAHHAAFMQTNHEIKAQLADIIEIVHNKDAEPDANVKALIQRLRSKP